MHKASHRHGESASADKGPRHHPAHIRTANRVHVLGGPSPALMIKHPAVHHCSLDPVPCSEWVRVLLCCAAACATSTLSSGASCCTKTPLYPRNPRCGVQIMVRLSTWLCLCSKWIASCTEYGADHGHSRVEWESPMICAVGRSVILWCFGVTWMHLSGSNRSPSSQYPAFLLGNFRALHQFHNGPSYPLLFGTWIASRDCWQR